MTDSNETNTGPEMGSSADDSFAWTEPETPQASRGEQAREWLTQLQAMIENLATKAGEKAGPVAQRAAEITGQAGTKLAERSRDLAAELRRDAAAAKTPATSAADGAEPAADAAAEPTADEPTASGVA